MTELTGINQGWHSRGYLPHRDLPQKPESVTFRLADSVSQATLRQLEQELAGLPKAAQATERRRRIEHWLDAGLGCCALRHPRMAAAMAEALRWFEGERYRLLAWCIMPNHVHVLVAPLIPLPEIVHTWKSYTGHWALAHRVELGLAPSGRHFWMREYWDRYIRDEDHLRRVVQYIHHNPVQAGLCAAPQDWRWSSAYIPQSVG